jgi:methionine aminotransferase
MSKLPNIGTSIYSNVTDGKRIQCYQSLPRIPKFPSWRKTNEYCRLAKDVHQYLPMAGYPPLLSKIALLVQSSYGRTPNPDTEILVTAGATQAILPQYKP